MKRFGWIIFYVCFGAFVLSISAKADTLSWQQDKFLLDYQKAGHITGYKVFFKITDNCDFEENYNYSVDVGDQTSLELLGNDYFIPGRTYKFQIKSYAIIKGMVYESRFSQVVGCYEPRPLTGTEQLKLKKKSKTIKEKR